MGISGIDIPWKTYLYNRNSLLSLYVYGQRTGWSLLSTKGILSPYRSNNKLYFAYKSDNEPLKFQ